MKYEYTVDELLTFSIHELIPFDKNVYISS